MIASKAKKGAMAARAKVSVKVIHASVGKKKKPKKLLAAASKPKPRLRPMHKPSATVGPVKSRARAKKGVATAKDKAKPKKKIQIKGPRRSKRVGERALNADSSDAENDEGLAKRRRKLTKRRQRNASNDDSSASGHSCYLVAIFFENIQGV